MFKCIGIQYGSHGEISMENRIIKSNKEFKFQKEKIIKIIKSYGKNIQTGYLVKNSERCLKPNMIKVCENEFNFVGGWDITMLSPGTPIFEQTF